MRVTVSSLEPATRFFVRATVARHTAQGDSLAITHTSSRLQRQEFRIGATPHPGFHAEPGYVPKVGEEVQTTEGEAEVVRVLNRVTSGRLLELRLKERPAPPFFAGSNNVLIRDPLDGGETSDEVPDETSD